MTFYLDTEINKLLDAKSKSLLEKHLKDFTHQGVFSSEIDVKIQRHLNGVFLLTPEKGERYCIPMGSEAITINLKERIIEFRYERIEYSIILPDSSK